VIRNLQGGQDRRRRAPSVENEFANKGEMMMMRKT